MSSSNAWIPRRAPIATPSVSQTPKLQQTTDTHSKWQILTCWHCQSGCDVRVYLSQTHVDGGEGSGGVRGSGRFHIEPLKMVCNTCFLHTCTNPFMFHCCPVLSHVLLPLQWEVISIANTVGYLPLWQSEDHVLTHVDCVLASRLVGYLWGEMMGEKLSLVNRRSCPWCWTMHMQLIPRSELV